MILKPQFFDFAILFFISTVLLLVVFMLFFLYLKTSRTKKLGKWKLMADLLIRKAIFFDEEEENAFHTISVTTRATKLLADKLFRKLLTSELINAKKNVSGTSADNLNRLYLQLNFDRYALERLASPRWYVKAQAIQELSVMGLKETLTKIYRYTNNQNELLRMEAQIAVVKFHGFEGLRFLDVVSYPVTEWQQIKLLHELSHLSPDNFSGVEKWLKSENKTVVAFALKLVRNYHRFELHDMVTSCLVDEDANVRLQAIYTLGEIYTDQTSGILIDRLLKEDIKHQLAIVRVLQNIATEDDIPVLLDQLSCENVDLKGMLARALVKIGAQGYDSLRHHELANQYPLTNIIAQIKSEFVL
jgi:hypothetical protein